MESVRLEHENTIELVLVTLRDRVEEWRWFLNEEKDLIILKEMNQELYEVKAHSGSLLLLFQYIA